MAVWEIAAPWSIWAVWERSATASTRKAAPRTRNLRLTLLTRLAAALARHSGARRLHWRGVNERPLVVMRAALVESNGGIRALAGDSDDPTGGSAAWCGRACRSGLPAAPSVLLLSLQPSLGRRLTATLRTTTRLHASLLRCLRQRKEVFAGDGIFVFPPQELLLDEQLEVRRIGVCIFALKQADGVHVLLASKHQLCFFFALSGVLPSRHCGRHDNGHDSNADNDRSHGVPVVSLTSISSFALTR